MSRLFGCVVLALAVFAVAGTASAGGYRGYKSARADTRDVRIKDCTRINGRYGYYGNIWCTPAEQARWDALSARRWVR